MEDLLILAGIGVLSLILGYLFIKHYDKIDIRFFGRNKHGGPTVNGDEPGSGGDADYKPFGRIQVLVSAALEKGEIRLDDGTIVKKRKGLLGEDNYYDKNDSSRSFDRSGDVFTKR